MARQVRDAADPCKQVLSALCLAPPRGFGGARGEHLIGLFMLAVRWPNGALLRSEIEGCPSVDPVKRAGVRRTRP